MPQRKNDLALLLLLSADLVRTGRLGLSPRQWRQLGFTNLIFDEAVALVPHRLLDFRSDDQLADELLELAALVREKFDV